MRKSVFTTVACIAYASPITSPNYSAFLRILPEVRTELKSSSSYKQSQDDYP